MWAARVSAGSISAAPLLSVVWRTLSPPPVLGEGCEVSRAAVPLLICGLPRGWEGDASTAAACFFVAAITMPPPQGRRRGRRKGGRWGGREHTAGRSRLEYKPALWALGWSLSFQGPAPGRAEGDRGRLCLAHPGLSLGGMPLLYPQEQSSPGRENRRHWGSRRLGAHGRA